MATTTSFADNRTQWVPIGEFELGLDRRGGKQYWGNEPVPVKAVRIAAVFHVYGNLGVVSPASIGRFSDSNLYLAGGCVQAEF